MANCLHYGFGGLLFGVRGLELVQPFPISDIALVSDRAGKATWDLGANRIPFPLFPEVAIVWSLPGPIPPDETSPPDLLLGFVDNIRFHSVPEPAGVLLLVVAGAAWTIRRNRSPSSPWS